MIRETTHINWFLLISLFCWMSGIAVFIALFGYMQYLKVRKELNLRDFLKSRLFKTGTGTGIALIILGIVLIFFKLPSPKLITSRIDFFKNDFLACPLMNNFVSFPPSQLKMDPHNKSHVFNNEKIKDNTMVLFWDGNIQTPFIRFNKGSYRLTFEAKGSKAEDEYSKLKIEFETPDKNRYLVSDFHRYVELYKRMKRYYLYFDIDAETIGRIRNTYYNDLYVPEKRKGRDVWIRNVTITRR